MMSENRDYLTLPEESGSIHIAEEVIAAIAVGAVREVEGISGMMTGMGGTVSELVNKKNAVKGLKGVKIDMTGDTPTLDLYVTVQYGAASPEVAEDGQKAVISSGEAMTGCAVGMVNVHVGGVTIA